MTSTTTDADIDGASAVSLVLLSRTKFFASRSPIHSVQPSAKPSPVTVIGVRTSNLLRFGVIDVIVRVVRAVSAMM